MTMIFATVGTQLPFDRLLTGLDRWALRHPDVPILAQIGASQRRFPAIKTAPQLSQAAFRAQIEAARLVVAHAGMGTILTAAELGKPVILMPRRAKFNEHRNDHQRDTANEMRRLSNVSVVDDGEALHVALDRALNEGFVTAPEAHGAQGDIDELIAEIRDFVWMDARPMRPRVSDEAARAA
jgi:UDP-N-acetylglucosamine transferase subunit ALG13